MTGRLERRTGWSPPLLPELFDWIETGMPGWRITPGMHGIRIEEQMADDAYLISAELPGIDPGRDVEITVDDDVLTLRAERSEEAEDKHRTEFRYGTFARSLRLPPGARGEEATASYKNGILTVKVPIAEVKTGTKTIPVHREGP